MRQRQYEEAERALLQALREAKRGFGEEDEHVGAAYCNLAEVYRLMGRHEEALGHYEEVLFTLNVGLFCDILNFFTLTHV